MKALFLLSLLPIAAYCQEEVFSVSSKDSSFHILFNEKDFEEGFGEELDEEFDEEWLSIFSKDLEEEKLPWAEEPSAEEITAYLEKRAQSAPQDFDDVFAYESIVEGQKDYQPTQERIPKTSNGVFGRPRVVQSKPESRRSPLAQKSKEGSE